MFYIPSIEARTPVPQRFTPETWDSIMLRGMAVETLHHKLMLNNHIAHVRPGGIMCNRGLINRSGPTLTGSI